MLTWSPALSRRRGILWMVRGREEGYLCGYLATLVRSDSSRLLAPKEGFDSPHPLQDMVCSHPSKSF